MKQTLILFFAGGLAAWSQANRGELRLTILNPSGAAVSAEVELSSIGNAYEKTFLSDGSGRVAARSLPLGTYEVRIAQPGFAPFHERVEIRYEAPVTQEIHLGLTPVHTEISVTDSGSLIDLSTASSVVEISADEIRHRLSSLPGRSVQDLVASQPGWLYEGNAVLHPRGSEYQTQFLVDGIPLTDNRSPGFGPEIEADDLESLSIYTAGFPAEYGRKLGGVVELDTRRQTDRGMHGDLILSGGSYRTGSAYGRLQNSSRKNTIAVTASGSTTDHYLNPVVPQNYTNNGTTADFSARYERDFSDADRLSVDVRHELSRFLIPNELIQEQAGQIQNGDNLESLAGARFQHVFTSDSLLTMAGLIRVNHHDLDSNRNPTPIAPFNHDQFSDGYFKVAYSVHRGAQELKTGVESDATLLHENFQFTITDPTQFDPGTPSSFVFTSSRPDLEQSAFVEDTVREHKWIMNAGLRWDHYQLLLNRNALSPRLSAARAFQSKNAVIHFAYDRVFQTPSSDNILLSSSSRVAALGAEFLRLPVQPSTGNDYELGGAKSLADRVRLDINAFRRDTRNFADDSQLLNTSVSYPIAFRTAAIYGAEAKLEAMSLGSLSGYASYSYAVGRVSFPVTGGLFLGQDAANALSRLSGHIADSQDQRNTLATRFEYKIGARIRVAAGASYGSGLPFDFGGTAAQALAEYGSAVASRLNFDRGRVRPSLAVNSSIGVSLRNREHFEMTVHIDGENLNNRLNVLDFGGLFSGNAIAPARSVFVRLDNRF